MVPLNFVELFEAEWRVRELGMKKVDGFKELNIAREGSDYVVTSSWKSIPAWEAWSCSTVARRSHLPHVSTLSGSPSCVSWTYSFPEKRVVCCLDTMTLCHFINYVQYWLRSGYPHTVAFSAGFSIYASKVTVAS